MYKILLVFAVCCAMVQLFTGTCFVVKKLFSKKEEQ